MASFKLLDSIDLPFLLVIGPPFASIFMLIQGDTCAQGWWYRAAYVRVLSSLEPSVLL